MKMERALPRTSDGVTVQWVGPEVEDSLVP
jgi:hypothetical protein